MVYNNFEDIYYKIRCNFFIVFQLEEYINHPYVHETNRFFAERFLECRKNGIQIEASNIFSGAFKKNQVIYSINFQNAQSSDGKNDQENTSCSDVVNGGPKI